MNHPAFLLASGLIVLVTALVCLLTWVATRRFADNQHLEFETRKVFFAAACLSGLGLVYILAMMFNFYADSELQRTAAKEIWNDTKTIVPPLAALVIGFYFSRGDGSRQFGDRDKKEMANKVPEPATTAVTSPAVPESRQP